MQPLCFWWEQHVNAYYWQLSQSVDKLETWVTSNNRVASLCIHENSSQLMFLVLLYLEGELI